MPLSPSGLTLPTQAQIIDAMVSDYEALTGLVLDTTRTDDQATMISISIVTDRIAACYEALRGIYDGTNIDAAEGVQLQDGSRLVGVDPDPASYSTATVSCLGTNGTVIPQGTIVEGGGDDDDARWTTTSDITIAGGSTDVLVQAQIAGPTVAVASSINKIVTAVAGWASVTNAAEATPGLLRESDSLLRRKRRASLTVRGSSSSSSVLANLLALDYVNEAVVIQNASNATAVVSGKTLDANAIWVFLNPVLTAAQQDSVAALLHKKVAAGTQMMNSGGGTAVVKQVTDEGKSTSRQVSWDSGSAQGMYLTVSVDLAPGYVAADVEPGIQEALLEFFTSSLGMGSTLTEYGMIQAIVLRGVEGLESVSVGAGILPSTIVALPYTPSIDVTLTLAASNIMLVVI